MAPQTEHHREQLVRFGEGATDSRLPFEGPDEAVLLIDPVGDRILNASPGASALLGYSKEELLHTPVSTIHPDEMPALLAFARHVDHEGCALTDKLSCCTKTGDLIPVEICASLVSGPAGLQMLARIRPARSFEQANGRRRTHLDAARNPPGDGGKNTLSPDDPHGIGLPVCPEAMSGGTSTGRVDNAVIVGVNPGMRQVFDDIVRVAATDANVLIYGETGTGKELVAQAIHNHSARGSKPLVCVNCSAVPGELFESEFFGRVRGAFTGAVSHQPGRFRLAHGGTLLLDEVGEIPLELQTKFLRVLEEGRFEPVGSGRSEQANVRVIAASNRDLKEAVAKHRFRPDLYYRLNVVPIVLPPLRERREDIPHLVRHFLALFARRGGRQELQINESELEYLQQYAWPGNVRELRNVLERAVILSRDGRLRVTLKDAGQAPAPAPLDQSRQPVRVLTEAERKQRDWANIGAALAVCGGKVAGLDGAAELLGIKPTTLASRMKAMEISRRKPC